MTQPRIGVFVCECGGNISDYVDVDKLTKIASTWSDVIISRKDSYLCSGAGLEIIKDQVRRLNLNRVVIGACTPKLHLTTFREALDGLINFALVDVVNIREQCSFVHPEKENATLKAISLVKGAVERIKRASELRYDEVEVTKSVLIVGGGIAGITAALCLARSGIKVYLVEKEPTIGGHAIKYSKLFPTFDCSQCILTPKMAEVSRDPNITLFTLATLKDVSGVPGNYTVTIRLKPRGVDIKKCTACGACNRVCKVKAISEFDEGIGERKAIYIPLPQAIPTAYVVDFENCTKCGECIRVCPTQAINLDARAEEVKVNVGAIVIATGFSLFDLTKLRQYMYGVHKNVLTPLQMERMIAIDGPTKGRIVRLSDGHAVSKVAYGLCIGSRDVTKGVPYCSKVCCLYSIKQAILLAERGINVDIYYIDIRAAGRRYEELYKTAQERGVRFIRGKIAEVKPYNGNLLSITIEDTILGRMITDTYDLLVLCPPIVPEPEALKTIELLKAPVDEDNFVLEKHPKLDPLSTKQVGIYACGMATGPKDIQYTVAEAEGVAMKVNNFVSVPLKIEPYKAFITNIEKCNGCGECMKICPVGAIEIVEGKARINRILCNGCRACVPVCPFEILDVQGYTNEQISSMIIGMLAERGKMVKIIAFVEREIAYTSIDLAGTARLTYPSTIRIIDVPSTCGVTFKHILTAFAYGADGIMLIEAPVKEGPLGKAHEIAEERAEEYKRKLEEYGISSVRLWFSRLFTPEWRKVPELFNSFNTVIESEGPLAEEVRDKIREILK